MRIIKSVGGQSPFTEELGHVGFKEPGREGPRGSQRIRTNLLVLMTSLNHWVRISSFSWKQASALTYPQSHPRKAGRPAASRRPTTRPSLGVLRSLRKKEGRESKSPPLRPQSVAAQGKTGAPGECGHEHTLNIKFILCSKSVQSMFNVCSKFKLCSHFVQTLFKFKDKVQCMFNTHSFFVQPIFQMSKQCSK